MVHLEPIVFTARLLPEGGQYGDDYKAVATIQKLGSMGWISACHGKISKKVLVDLSKELEKHGITELKWVRGK